MTLFCLTYIACCSYFTKCRCDIDLRGVLGLLQLEKSTLFGFENDTRNRSRFYSEKNHCPSRNFTCKSKVLFQNRASRCFRNTSHCISSFVEIGPLVPEKIFEGFYHIWTWRPSWSWVQHHVNKFSFPCT